ncbi:DUF2036 domain containing protein, partial [Trichuris trichiura]
KRFEGLTEFREYTITRLWLPRETYDEYSSIYRRDLLSLENNLSGNCADRAIYFGTVASSSTLVPTVYDFNLEDFEKIWQESVPDGMLTSFDHLVDIAVVHDEESPAFIEYFPHFDLPDEAADRLKTLFTCKEQWSFTELKPYLRLHPWRYFQT